MASLRVKTSASRPRTCAAPRDGASANRDKAKRRARMDSLIAGSGGSTAVAGSWFESLGVELDPRRLLDGVRTSITAGKAGTRVMQISGMNAVEPALMGLPPWTSRNDQVRAPSALARSVLIRKTRVVRVRRTGSDRSSIDEYLCP